MNSQFDSSTRGGRCPIFGIPALNQSASHSSRTGPRSSPAAKTDLCVLSNVRHPLTPHWIAVMPLTSAQRFLSIGSRHETDKGRLSANASLTTGSFRRFSRQANGGPRRPQGLRQWLCRCRGRGCRGESMLKPSGFQASEAASESSTPSPPFPRNHVHPRTFSCQTPPHHLPVWWASAPR